jgi:hypothetical protein
LTFGTFAERERSVGTVATLTLGRIVVDADADFAPHSC